MLCLNLVSFICWKYENTVCYRLLIWKTICVTQKCLVDSPGIPPSATAHELFRGFSFVAPALLDDNHEVKNPLLDNHNLKNVSLQFSKRIKPTMNLFMVLKDM